MAIGKNIATAAVDLPLRRERPQSICPEVQPFDNLVPYPLSNPTPIVTKAATNVDGIGGWLVTSSGKNTFKGSALIAMPAKKATVSLVGVENNLRKYPETPSILPF